LNDRLDMVVGNRIDQEVAPIAPATAPATGC